MEQDLLFHDSSSYLTIFSVSGLSIYGAKKRGKRKSRLKRIQWRTAARQKRWRGGVRRDSSA